MEQDHEYSDAETNPAARNMINDSSLNYSTALTPSAFHSRSGADFVIKKGHKMSTEDLTQQQQQQQPQQYKNDRLKKICTMALDLQTKLQQTKLKLFGLNPNDENMIYYDKSSTTDNEQRGSHLIISL